MDLVSLLISAGLFYAFIPGVLFRYPKHGSPQKVMLVHTALFALTTSIVMRYYWTYYKGVFESMGNYGIQCPNGYVGQDGDKCVPAGRATYNPGVAGSGPSSPVTK
jgi:hypothetical protein